MGDDNESWAVMAKSVNVKLDGGVWAAGSLKKKKEADVVARVSLALSVDDRYSKINLPFPLASAFGSEPT